MPSPVTPPANATAYLNLEAQPGWTANDSSSIGPHPLVIKNIVQVTPPPIQPPTTLTFETQGTPGDWCDVMYTPKAIAIPEGPYAVLIRTTVIFNDAINANFESGFRATNVNGITNNGEFQFVPLANTQYKEMEFDVVPGPNGGWKDTSLRFPTFLVGPANAIEYYATADSNNTLSPQYISVNGNLQAIPASCQNLLGGKQSPLWALLKAVPAFQIDANTKAVLLRHQVTMSVYFWPV
jgi:hypothetical protein